MAWCRQATSHYLSQCWPTSPSPYGVTRPQWVNYAGVLQQVPIFHEEGFQTPESSRCWEMTENLNPSDAGDRIFWLWQSVPCLLISWLLQSPEHQQAWYCLCETDSMYFCSRVNFICLGEAKSKIQNNKANLRDLIAATGLVISNWIQIVNFSARVTVKFDGWPCNTIGHLFYATSSFVHHFVAIGEFKLQLQSGNAQSGSNSMIFRAVRPWNLMDDLAKQ